MRNITISIFALLLIAACTDNGETGGGSQPERKPVWESYTHVRLMKFKGVVKQALQTAELESELLPQLKAEFDAAGNCTYYNATSIDPESATTYGWGFASVWHRYEYDAQGRMIRVTRYEVGVEPKVYTISYGTHELYIPTPFPLGEIEPLMLKGVTRIESIDYLLTSDGTTATADLTGTGWGAADSQTTYTFEEELPTEATTLSSRNGEELSRTLTHYTYTKNWLTRIESVTTVPESDGSDTQTLILEYSNLWPCTMTRKSSLTGTTTDFIMEYQYAENGLPKKAEYTDGDYFEDEFEQHYNSYDSMGNWTSSTKISGGDELLINQNLLYY